jgi:3-hydroxyisobutyrate dehydrogenase-like beta-hydroxyacid dehydrogenase
VMENKIGVLGLGAIGGGVARRLLKSGFKVTVYDIDSKKVDELESLGAERAKNIEGLFKAVEYLFSSLPNDDVILSAIKNCEKEVLKKSKTTFIELSTISPEAMKEIDFYFKNSSVNVIDCPISGGPLEAESGMLNLIVAGKKADVNECSKLFECISTKFIYVGEEIGSAKAIKLINNIMTMGNILVASEAFASGVSYGLDQKILFDTLSQTGGKSHHFLKRFPKVISNDYSPWFPIDLGIKDLNLALKWADNQSIKLKVTEFIKSQYEYAANDGLGKKDIVSLTKMFNNKFESGE